MKRYRELIIPQKGQAKRLVLRRERLRVLNNAELAAVVGGVEDGGTAGESRKTNVCY